MEKKDIQLKGPSSTGKLGKDKNFEDKDLEGSD